MILLCRCKHTYQDATYGPGMRVHNYARNALNKAGGWRCTVCGDTKPGAAPKESKT